MKRVKYISNGTITYEIIGEQGPQGPKGDTGKSAYQIAVDNGYNGTESEWIATLSVRNLAEKSVDLNSTTGINSNSVSKELISDNKTISKKSLKLTVLTESWTTGIYLSFNNSEHNLLNKLKVGKQYTFSIKLKASKKLTHPNGIFNVGILDNCTFISNGDPNSIDTEWRTYSVTGTYNRESNNALTIYVNSTAGDISANIYVSDFCVYEGNKEMTWIQAPEDLQIEIDNLKKEIEALKNLIK